MGTSAAGGAEILPFTEVAKFDRLAPPGGTNPVKVWRSDGKNPVGEAVFIPRLGYASRNQGDEEDGWVLFQRYLLDHHTVSFVLLGS